MLSEKLFRPIAGSQGPALASRPLIASLTLAELRSYIADQNPDRQRFPGQNAGATPLATLFARERDVDPFAVPTLADLVAFVEAYAGPQGQVAGKTAAQQAKARLLQFDLELKRTPFRPELIGDGFDGISAGLLEIRCLECVRAAGVLSRTTVRSFDHRAVRAAIQLEPGITAAILIAGTAPLDPGRLARESAAQIYSPDFQFLDERQVRQCHAEGILVLPWTVNEAADWERLLDWHVDGITTDYPDRLGEWLRNRGVEF